MRTRTFHFHAVASAVLVAAVPVAAWGLIGPLDEPGAPSEVSRAVEPPHFAEGLETTPGAVCLVLAVISGAVLVRASRRGTFERRWWPVLLPLVAAGLIAGVVGRVVTAATIGANIGAGLSMSVGVPAILLLLIVAPVVRLSQRRARR
ncbi:hypothetical protein [Streptomyces rimosus]|uniref:hypothetical protein n=1 Tax=Streptomyces rimosus TaxID=1927 RepID=UPI00067BF6BD|nr:hypothetical protein [Streptomyces rimosus]